MTFKVAVLTILRRLLILSFCYIFFKIFAAMSREERLARDMEQMPKRRRQDSDDMPQDKKELSKALTAEGK